MDAQEATSVLLGATTGYDGSLSEHQTLASFERRLVALPSMPTPAVQVEKVLDAEGSRIIQNFETELLLSDVDYQLRIKEEGF